MKKIVLKNYHLLDTQPNKMFSGVKSLPTFLLDEKLHGIQSRNRNRFISLIRNRAIEVSKERYNLLEEYAYRNDKKEVLFFDKEQKETTKPEDGVKYKISEENIKKVDNDFEKYLDEDFVLDVAPSNMDILLTVKDILLNSITKLSGKEAVMYDEWCSAFENITDEEK